MCIANSDLEGVIGHGKETRTWDQNQEVESRKAHSNVKRSQILQSIKMQSQ